MVRGCLHILHVLGLVSGVIFVLCSVVLSRSSAQAIKGRYETQILLAAVMLAATAFLQWNVMPAMDQDRAAVGDNLEAAPRDSAPRLHFERLHTRSEHIEEVVLFCGLGVIVLMGRESLPLKATS